MPGSKKLVFHKAKKNRIFQDVVDQIQEAIFSNKLNPGDFLPPERELRETFNVSRGTLREALRILEHKGLIEVRLGTGGGSLVRQAGVEQLNESIAILIRSGDLSVHDIGEFREGLEGRVAWLASQKADSNDIKKLEQLIDQASKLLETGLSAWEEFLEIDQKIHKELAVISRNSLYRYTAQVIHDNIRKYYDKYLDKTQSRMNENFQDLKNIVQSVKNRLPEKAAFFAENHVKNFNRRMREKEAVFKQKELKKSMVNEQDH